MISTSELSASFVEMADTLVADFDVVDFLDQLTRRAAAISGADAVGLLLADQRGRARLMAANNESAKVMELMQLQSSEGPCLDCIATGSPVVNADLGDAHDLWPVFAPRAREAGFESVHAFPMRLRGEMIGALNLFGGAETRFSDDEVRVVQALADVATIAILQQRSIARADELTQQLQGALNSRVVIEQAKGALAQSRGISPDDAFVLLRASARRSQRKLVDVAQDVLSRLEGSGPER